VVERGTQWYPVAHDEAISVGNLAGYSGELGLRIGAGIIASLSPKTDWDSNVLYAKQIVRYGYAPRQTEINNSKAVRILHGEDPLNVLGGMKVVPFFSAIVSPRGENAVPVIDRHAGSVYAFDEIGRGLTEKQQSKLSNVGVVTRIQGAYRKVARKEGIHVHCVQGITWVQHRIEKGYDKP
jgi:hypothetical protein